MYMIGTNYSFIATYLNSNYIRAMESMRALPREIRISVVFLVNKNLGDEKYEEILDT